MELPFHLYRRPRSSWNLNTLHDDVMTVAPMNEGGERLTA